MKTTFELPGFKLEVPALAKPSADLNKCDKELKQKFKDESVGFYNWPIDISTVEHQSIKDLAAQIRQDFSSVVCVGIGGSFLGAAALMDALHGKGNDKKLHVHWISNVDRTSLSEAESILKNGKTAFLFLSKSGNTIETLSALYAFHSHLGKATTFVVTDPKKGELRRLATENGWRAFPIPENIGGRFSVFTAIGLLPMEIRGIDTRQLLEGAKEMRRILEATPPERNPAYWYALHTYEWATKMNRNIHVLMPYESSLAKIGDWFVQLWAESIGKKRKLDGKSVGFTPIRCLGTTDQHSQLQLFKEGPADKVIGFIDVEGERLPGLPMNPFVSEPFRFLTKHSVEAINHEALLAVQKSLELSGTPTYRFILSDLSERTLGSLLFFQMTACAFAGELFQVNAFDQPGVEEAKRLLAQAL